MTANDKVNVLLVDDQPAKLMAYEVILSGLGETLLKASSAREAFEHLLRNDIAIVLIDVCMPELDGFQLAAMIREHPRFQRTAIIFISAIHLTDVDRLRGYEMGAVDYVPVPVVPEVLRAKVKVFAELHRATRLLEGLNAELEHRVRQRTEELEASTKRLLQSERLQSLALAAGKMGAWTWDTANGECSWDEGQCRIFGLEPCSFRAPVERLRSFIHPEDWWPLIETIDGLTQDAQTCQIEFRARRPNGEIRWCVGAAAANVESNRVVRISGVTADITDQKLADERRTLLVREVDHRARNALAVVQSIVRLTKAPAIEDFRTAVEGRIRALSTAHALLSESRWEGANLDRLVHEELAPYLRADAHRITLQGPSIILQPSVAQILAVVLHELATNAAKYGALSQGSGTVCLSWELSGGDLVLRWDENGGPPVVAPAAPGYGTKVITASVEQQLGGSVVFEWSSDGLHFTMAASLGDRLEQPVARLNGDRTGGSEPVRPRTTKVQGRRLLLVEDEILVGMMMHDTLSELGFDVIGPISTMAEAAEAIEHEEFDAAILDVNLSGEFIYPLADIVASRGLPFVFVTGYAAEGIEPRFAQVPVLQKPIEIERLQEIFVVEDAERTGSPLRAISRG